MSKNEDNSAFQDIPDRRKKKVIDIKSNDCTIVEIANIVKYGKSSLAATVANKESESH